MDNIYGINVTNKFALFYNEDIDPLEILAKKEKKQKDKANVDQEKKKKDEKPKKDKNTKKTENKTENKNKPVEEVIKPVKEEKANAPRQNDRPRTARQNFNKEDNRPPRRRDGNNQENRNFQDRPERQDRFEKSDRPERFDSGGFGRPDRLEGGQREGGFGGQREGGFGGDRGFGGERGFGRGRGGRGGRGRGGRGGRGGGERGFGGGFGKREFERHSGSDRTGVKATDKREGGGSHNWGTVKDDIDLPPKVDYWRDPKEQMKETTEETTQDWNQTNEDTENKDPNESTESAPVEGEQEDQPKQMTLDEWKKLEETKRMKSQFKLRKANEGVDMSQWKNARMYRKSEGEDSDEEEEDEDEDDEEEAKSKRLINEIKITFNDSPRRGRGGRRPRGPRGGGGGGRGSGRGGDRRGANVAPRFDDEKDFPALNIKTAA